LVTNLTKCVTKRSVLQKLSDKALAYKCDQCVVLLCTILVIITLIGSLNPKSSKENHFSAQVFKLKSVFSIFSPGSCSQQLFCIICTVNVQSNDIAFIPHHNCSRKIFVLRNIQARLIEQSGIGVHVFENTSKLENLSRTGAPDNLS